MFSWKRTPSSASPDSGTRSAHKTECPCPEPGRSANGELSSALWSRRRRKVLLGRTASTALKEGTASPREQTRLRTTISSRWSACRSGRDRAKRRVCHRLRAATRASARRGSACSNQFVPPRSSRWFGLRVCGTACRGSLSRTRLMFRGGPPSPPAGRAGGDRSHSMRRTVGCEVPQSPDRRGRQARRTEPTGRAAARSRRPGRPRSLGRCREDRAAQESA